MKRIFNGEPLVISYMAIAILLVVSVLFLGMAIFATKWYYSILLFFLLVLWIRLFRKLILKVEFKENGFQVKYLYSKKEYQYNDIRSIRKNREGFLGYDILVISGKFIHKKVTFYAARNEQKEILEFLRTKRQGAN